MDIGAWLNKPIEIRLQWYCDELEDLIDYLSGEPFSEKSMMLKSRKTLLSIKRRMEHDIERGSNKSIGGNDHSGHLKYYNTVSEAYQKLPMIESGRQKWKIKLSQVKNTLIKMM